MKFGGNFPEVSSRSFHHAATHTLTHTDTQGAVPGFRHTLVPVDRRFNGTKLRSEQTEEDSHEAAAAGWFLFFSL